ncbi:MAG TPA: site-specific integrase [Patescibacteria group bacterium]|nr:site-specific integrase [Patescibacteria group bacterium]
MARKVRGIFERPTGSGDWWIRYHDQHGREHREKVGRRSAAIAAYQKRKTEIRECRFFPEQLRHRARISFNQIADDALLYAERHKGERSAREDRWKMTRLRAWFGDCPAADLRPEEIDSRLAELTRRGRAPATVNQYRALLSLTYSLAVRAGKVAENPLRRVPIRRTNNARVRFLTAQEEMQLRSAIRRLCPHREAEIDLALHTGMRRGEQYGLRWQDIDIERSLITIPRSKHGEKRWLPINSAARRALDLLREQGHGLRVCGPRGRRWFDRAVQAAGIRDFRYHDLRHTFASRLVMAGVDLRTVQELMGHKTLLMTLRYAHLSEAHTREAIEKLAAGAGPLATGTRSGTSASLAEHPSAVTPISSSMSTGIPGSANR